MFQRNTQSYVNISNVNLVDSWWLEVNTYPDCGPFNARSAAKLLAISDVLDKCVVMIIQINDVGGWWSG